MTDSERTLRAGRVPTLHDVATRAAVSPMTASRALRGDKGVSETRRMHIIAVAEELGYQRNALARGLRLGGSTKLVALVVTNLANPFYARLATGLESVIEPHGMRLVLGDTREDPEREKLLVADLVERRVSGIVIIPSGVDHEHLRPAVLGGAAIVFATRPPHGVEADVVLVDDFGGAFAATRHLLQEGHTRIAFLGNPPTVYTSGERFRGYSAALAEAGIEVRSGDVVRSCTDANSAERAAARLFRRKKPPSAVFATNNLITLGTLLAARSTATPVTIGGFDEIEYERLLSDPLYLVKYDAAEIGRRAGELLLGRLASGAVPYPPVRLVVSTVLDQAAARQVEMAQAPSAAVH